MKRKILFFPIILLLINFTAQASNPNKTKTESSSKGTSFVLRTGLNFAKIHDLEFTKYDLDPGERMPMKPGVLIAIGVNCSVNKYFSIQPELAFSQKGRKITYREGADREIYTKTLNYLEMPIMFNGGYSNEKFEVFGSFGPSIGFWISEMDKTKTRIDGVKDVDKDKIDLKKEDGDSYAYNRLEAGINVGVGGGYKIKGMVVGLELRGNIGMTSHFRRTKDAPSGSPKADKVTNRVLSMTLYLKFGKKSK